MKLKDATPEQKIQALAELDGRLVKFDHNLWQHNPYPELTGNWILCDNDTEPTKYLTSYDAIIPLVQKQLHQAIWVTKFLDCLATLHGKVDIIYATPTQLADALLIATGKMTL